VLLCAYQTVEVVYSIDRRRRQRRAPASPDRHHLHSLVATQLVHPRLQRAHPNLRNAAVSVVMWICAVLPVLPAMFFYNRPDILLPALAACFLAYHLFYRRVANLAGSSSQAVPTQEDAADATT
jgi:hypothetical protein